MTPDEVLAAFQDADALLNGHFILSSGRHSPQFLQKMRVFMSPGRTAPLCAALAQKIRDAYGAIDVVVSPAVGGIIPGYETARHLPALAMFVERENGAFALRRGFELPQNARIVIVEDIVTTGLSLNECVAAVAPLAAAVNGTIFGAACLIDRSNGTAQLNVPLVSLVQLDIPSYAPNELPSELAALPAVKPGSRHLTS
jgi:orotate phosphoribosyltransferase